MLYLGVTGTQNPGPGSYTIIAEYLAHYSPLTNVVVQGCCIGVDEQVALIADDLGFDVNGVVPANRYKVSQAAIEVCKQIIYMPPGISFMDRNDELIRMINKLAGFPKTETEELRSGTWATIRRGWKKFGVNNVDILPVGAS